MDADDVRLFCCAESIKTPRSALQTDHAAETIDASKPKERCVLIRSGFGVAIAAMGLLAVGHTTPAFAQAGVCTGNGKISKQIAKPMAAAQDAQKAKKWQ